MERAERVERAERRDLALGADSSRREVRRESGAGRRRAPLFAHIFYLDFEDRAVHTLPSLWFIVSDT